MRSVIAPALHRSAQQADGGGDAGQRWQSAFRHRDVGCFESPRVVEDSERPVSFCGLTDCPAIEHRSVEEAILEFSRRNVADNHGLLPLSCACHLKLCIRYCGVAQLSRSLATVRQLYFFLDKFALLEPEAYQQIACDFLEAA